jgi:Protein of unknown function (DUF2934)
MLVVAAAGKPWGEARGLQSWTAIEYHETSPMTPAKEAEMAKHTTISPKDIRRPTQPTDDLQEAIRFRAYQLFEQRGGDHGHDVEDWLQAEWELTQRKTDRTAA